jgi:mono/diheme cytochrome c family protein
MLKKLLIGVGVLLLLVVLGAAGFVYAQASAFDASMSKVYAVKPPQLAASTDPLVIARGKHLAEAIGGCFGCHGPDLGGKPGDKMGPVGVLYSPNLTRGTGGAGNRYSDAQLARVIRDGIKADGHSLRFMPAQDLSWWPDDDLVAIVSFVRSVPPVDRSFPPSTVGVVGKVLDRIGMLPLDVARRIDHDKPRPKTLAPTPTAEYGAELARACQGCHGPGLSGGPIPGAPPSMPIPANITPDPSGIKLYTEADFNHLLDSGVKRSGKPLDPFMPIATLRAMNDVERKALFAYLMSLPPKPFGGR